ncbi:MAG: LD-carboxypeptidase [Rhodoferax sp.]|uniref:LD-carboxypeptidase n=1 Tax=Rhodoferax sp. TaxID=50421 RepID=UPI001400964C|nr:LD-carboxypeptidase [Rhodoferax sp.]NDP40354.1 LD-carboxypeptidase [Rhodoferax sp.]
MNKHIYIYSPSGAVRDKAAFKRGVARLESLGHEVEVDAAALASHLRFAGDDETRLAAIHRAAASGADVALISRGGYGLSRILPGIHYKAVAKAIDQGMRFVGISDFTAFQSAVLAKTGRVTWAGPGLCEGFGVGGKQVAASVHVTAPQLVPDDIMEACFDDLISGQGEGAGWRQLREPVSSAASHLPVDANLIATKAISTGATASFGINKSILWGGNLSLLCSLLGTPYLPEVKGGILFLEDVAEHPYRIERMLTQLLHAGVLARQKAILLGQFTDFKLVPHDRGYKLQTVVNWLRQQTKTPVLTNLPYGHVATKVLLPVGAKTDLMVQGRDALLFWGHT